MRKYAIFLIVLGLVFWFPLTRGLVLFLLPLGSGVDDLIFVIAMGAGLSLYALGRANTIDDRSRTRWVWAITLVSILGIAGILISMIA